MIAAASMHAVVIVFAVLSLAAWLSAAIHGIWSLGHLSGKNRLLDMLLHGMRWFDAESFTARGQELHRRFVRSFAAFFLCLLLLVASAALLGR